jgi:hypothetical protein
MHTFGADAEGPLIAANECQLSFGRDPQTHHAVVVHVRVAWLIANLRLDVNHIVFIPLELLHADLD